MMHSLLVFMGLLLASPLVFSQQPSIGPLINGNFEICADGQPIPFWQDSGSGAVTAQCSSTFTRNSTFSARLFPQFTPGQFSAISQNVSITEAGETFTISYYVRVGDEPSPRPVEGINTTLTVDGVVIPPISTTISPPEATAEGFSLIQQTFVAPNQGGIVGTLTIAFVAQDDTNIYVDDISISVVPVVVGDPSFVGLRGQSYQVHGVDGEIYNLVSSPDCQVNSRFVFLDHGRCPIINGKPSTNCWSHAGSYLGEIGVQQRVDDHLYKLFIQAGDAAEGFKSIVLDGQKLSVADSFNHTDACRVTYDSTHRVTVQTEQFIFVFENSDMFINQMVISRVSLTKLTCHGMFGQTHRAVRYPSKLRYIEGDVDDYVVLDADIFGSSFVYNQFVSE